MPGVSRAVPGARWAWAVLSRWPGGAGAGTRLLSWDQESEPSPILHRVDQDSALHNDLQILKEKEGADFILLNFSFKVRLLPFLPSPLGRGCSLCLPARGGHRAAPSDRCLCLSQDNFPFDPPFVRVVSPVLSGG